MWLSEERISYLLRVYTDGTATQAEEHELYEWAAEVPDDAELRNQIAELVLRQKKDAFKEVNWDRIYERIRQNIHQSGSFRSRPKGQWLRVAAVLIVIALGVTSAYWFSANKVQEVPLVENRETPVDIKPGATRAILQGAHGTVALSGKDTSFVLAGNRVQINDSGLHIAKGKAVQYTLTVPRGGTYRVVLPDGTQAWLNADSRLEYPSVFTKDTREVSLTGEAYFEVKTDADHPFIVKLPSSTTGEGQGEVRVLGTAFNIQAYPEDKNVITTLIQGKVQVNSKDKQLVLSPGEQALLNREGQLALNPHADLEQVVAWKNGYFRFDKADIYTIMEQLARWYNVTVNYADHLPPHHFGAIISRNNNISGILNMLEATGEVHFKLKGKEIMVMP